MSTVWGGHVLIERQPRLDPAGQPRRRHVDELADGLAETDTAPPSRRPEAARWIGRSRDRQCAR
jgi:hypothetical protein